MYPIFNINKTEWIKKNGLFDLSKVGRNVNLNIISYDNSNIWLANTFIFS